MLKNITPPEYTAEQVMEVQRVLNAQDSYEILAVEQSATKEDVQKSFKKLSLVLHPDKNKAPNSGEAFRLLAEAKEKLQNILEIRKSRKSRNQ